MSTAARRTTKKDPRAVALGRKGGLANMRNLTKAQKSELGRRAVTIRWARAKAAGASGGSRRSEGRR